MQDVKAKTVGLTRFVFRIPSYKRTLVYLLAFSFVAGFLLHLSFTQDSVADSFLFGGSEGILVLALPAALAAILSASFVSRKNFRQGLKYFLFISFASTILVSAAYFVGTVFNQSIGLPLEAFILVANALIYGLWFISSFIGLNHGKKSFLIAFIHPLLNLSFLEIYRGYVLFVQPLETNPVILFVRLIIASAILLLALWSIFFIVNAPAKRNLGVSIVEAATLFFAQGVSGSKGLESVFEEMSETARTFLNAVVFKKNGKVKACFLVPGIHFGPMGNLGGSEFPFLLTEFFGKKGIPAIVFHTTAYHDFNPVYSSSFKKIAREYEEMVSRANGLQSKAAFLESTQGNSQLFGFSLGKKAFLTLSRAPQNTEDIDAAVGMALKNKVLAQGFGEAILVDRHNSFISGRLFDIGSREYSEYEKAIEGIEGGEATKLRLGVAHDPLQDFSVPQGIGKAGLSVAVIEAGGKRACMVVVDANNLLPDYREEILRSLKQEKEFDFDFIDVFTTDTHSVNTLSMSLNPLGLRCDRKKLIERIRMAVHDALNDLEPCSAGIQSKEIELSVFGAKKSSELISTVSSIVSILKIIAPVVFLFAIIAAFALLAFVG
jgi:putative membrane protein